MLLWPEAGEGNDLGTNPVAEHAKDLNQQLKCLGFCKWFGFLKNQIGRANERHPAQHALHEGHAR
jgi:hypothetical protein